MRSIALFAIATISLCLVTPAVAASPFDGKWLADLKSSKYSQKPYKMVLADGTYHCLTCAPPYKIPADGVVHKVIGNSVFDAASVTVIDPQTARFKRYRGGKQISEVTDTISPDGSTMSWRATFLATANGIPVESSGTWARVAPGPAGSHVVSGSWRDTGFEAPAESLAMTLKITGGLVNMSYGTGESFAARFGGAPAPQIGDPTKTMIRVTRLGPNAFQERDYRAGKLVSVYTFRITGPKTMTVRSQDTERARTEEYTYLKQ